MYIFSGPKLAVALAKQLQRLSSIFTGQELLLTDSKEVVATAFGYKNWHELVKAADLQGEGSALLILRQDFDLAISKVLRSLALPQAAESEVKREFQNFLAFQRRADEEISSEDVKKKDEPFVWEVGNSPYPSLFLDGTKEFGSVNPIFLIDQYSGKRPALLNRKFLSQGRLDIQMFASALLDSNMFDSIVKFADGERTSDGTAPFLQFITKAGWEFNLGFYYREHLAKVPLDEFKEHARY